MRRAKSDYGAFNCRKHLRSAAGEKERKREGYVCYVMCVMGCCLLFRYFPATTKGGRERERTLNVNLTNKWSGRHEKTFVADADSSRKVYSVSQTHEVVDNNHSVGWPQFAKSHECPLRRVNERVDKEG